MFLNQKSQLQEVLRFTAPKYREGAEPCIYFYAYDPKTQAMKRKRIKISHLGSLKERKRRAPILCQRFMELLSSGWSPWIDDDCPHTGFNEAIEMYVSYISREQRNRTLKESSFKTYNSYIKMLRIYNDSRKKPIVYIYEMTEKFITDFLDWIHYERGNTHRTYNNYINFFNTLCLFFVKKKILSENPAEDIHKMKRTQTMKTRNNFADKDIRTLFSRLENHDRKYLLACYFTYYCFIRPNELYRIKVGDINIEHQTVFISAEISKNSLDATVTIPQVVIELINELGIMKHNKECYIFGEHFETSKKIGHNKMFGNYWDRFIIKDGGLCPEFKGKGYCFYSLKGTGITTMLKEGVPTIIVRDQARHQDITTTEIYTKGRNLKAPALLKDYKKK